QKDAIRPDFNKSIFIDFAGAKITSDVGFLLMRVIGQRFGIIENGCRRLLDARSAPHKKHTFEQNVRQTLEIADWAYVLENGRIALDGESRELLQDELVEKAYLGL
ncbi:MAG: hypothetical protein QGG48_08635, partial [Desulfatiglandales bacterium]|nr:hypothetical protein [Desulfatiglandales bacterium]